MLIEQTKDLRITNRMKIIQKLLSDSTYSRARLCKDTGLNKATVSTIVKEWMSWGLVSESTLADSTGGRKPILLQIKQDAGFAIAIDIQLKSFLLYTANLQNEIIEKHTIPFVSNDFSQNYTLLCDRIDTILNKMPASTYGLVGISICVRGVVDLDGMIRFIPALNWRNIDIYTLLKDRYNVPIYVDNDGNLSTLAELPSLADCKNVIMLSITDIVSAGIVTNGQLVYGHHGFANSIGHHTVNFSEPTPCVCGKHGCLEQYCSHQALFHAFKQQTGIDVRSIQDFIGLVKIQDKHALLVLEQFINTLAIGLSNIVFFFDCELIVLQSELIYHLPYLLSEIEKRIILPITGTQAFRISNLWEDGAILGASYLANVEFFRHIASQN